MFNDVLLLPFQLIKIFCSLNTKQAQVGRYPYVVRLNMGSVGNKLDSPYCGGILVAADTVVTAAHCVAYGSLDYVAIGKKFIYMNRDDVETWSHLIQFSMTQVATPWTTGKERTFA
jgi:hypothetical protein